MKATGTIMAVQMKPGKEPSGYATADDLRKKPTLSITLDIEIPDAIMPLSWTQWCRKLAYNQSKDLALRQWRHDHPPAPDDATDSKKKKKPKADDGPPWDYAIKRGHPTTPDLDESYNQYVDETHAKNAKSYEIAREAGVFLLLIRKRVHVAITPVQQMFTALLRDGTTAQLPAPIQPGDEAPTEEAAD